MSKKKLYTELPKYCKQMTVEELEVFFPKGEHTTAFLMRSLIMNEKSHCNRHETRTLRGVWYSAIKPTLDKLGLLKEEDQSEDGLRRWDATLSNYVCDLLRKGMLTFSDLGIVDISRQKSNPRETHYGISGSTYSYKATIAPYPNILIATEKDTVYSLISSIARLYGCSSISCKGQNSLGAMESIVKGMFNTGVDFDTIYILTMTDYDPAGYYIAEALIKQVKDILYSIGRDWIDVETHRIGITPDQISPLEVEQNKYSPKKANMDKWMERTGGINGEEKGLELDALSSTEIRTIFINNLKDFVDASLYNEFIKESYIRKKILESVQDRFDKMIESVTEEVIDSMQIKDFDINEFGIQGQGSLYIEDLCENDMDREIGLLAHERL